MKNIFILILSTLFLIGCGGSSDSNSTNNGLPDNSGGSADVNITIDLTTNMLETVYPGDILMKKSDNALIRINHLEGSDTSNVVLLEGNATIIRQP